MSNVTKGDLAYVVGVPTLSGKVVTVGEQARNGDTRLDAQGAPHVLVRNPDAPLGWWCHFRQPVMWAGALYRELPIYDSNLRRIAGPSVKVEGFTAIEIFPDISELDRVASAVQLRKTTHL